MPGDGEVIFERGTVWVEDRANQVLSQIDLQNAAIVRHVDGVLGGYMTYRDGIVWMSSFVLDSLLRINPDTGTVEALDVGPGEAGTTAVIGTPRGLWVANHYTGTLVRVDSSGKVVQTVQVAPPGEDGPQAMASDGESVWVAVNRDWAIVEVQLDDGEVVRRLDVGRMPCGSLAYADGRLWSGGCEGGTVITEIDVETGALRNVDLGTGVGRVIVAHGSVWALTFDPGQLLRIDPETAAIVGRLTLPADGNSIAASDGGYLWVRVIDKLLQVRPT